MVKKRLCICTSGQLRSDYTSLLSLKNAIDQIVAEEKFEVSVIFCVWRKIGRKIDVIHDLSHISRVFESDFRFIIPPQWYGDNFWSHLPETYKKQKSMQADSAEELIKSIFPDAIVNIEEDDVLDLSFDHKVYDVNSKKMLYMLWKCNEIKRKVEKDFGLFDYVLRMRSDLYISKIELPHKIENTIYVPFYKNGDECLGDAIALASSHGMDYYASIFSKCMTDNWEGIHEELYKHVVNSKFDAEEIENSGVQKLGLSQGKLLGISDFEKDENQPVKSLLKMYQYIEINQLIEAEKISKDIYQTLSEDDHKIMFFAILTFLYERMGEDLSAIKALIMTDLNYSYFGEIQGLSGRKKLLADRLIDLCKRMKFKTVPEFKSILKNNRKENWIDSVFELSNMGDSNIANVLKRDLQNTSDLEIEIRQLFYLKKYEKIVELAKLDKEMIVGADFYRDAASMIEGEDLENAYLLMSLAKALRPHGEFINQKMIEYKMKLEKM